MNYKQFFDTLNDNIKKSTTIRSLKNLERVGENYVKKILKDTEISSKTKSDVKKEFKKSRKLMLDVSKDIKD